MDMPLTPSGLLTTAYNIVAYRSKKRNPQGKHRMIPYITETFVLAILLAAFILGAVYTSSGRGACAGGEGEEGDGDEAGNGNVAGNGSPTACSLTKASTSFTVSLDVVADEGDVDGRLSTF